jgi:hypothetical protein
MSEATHDEPAFKSRWVVWIYLDHENWIPTGCDSTEDVGREVDNARKWGHPFVVTGGEIDVETLLAAARPAGPLSFRTEEAKGLPRLSPDRFFPPRG